MENRSNKTRNLVRIAMIAAIYTVLTLVIAPLSFGVVQFRISECLTVLPAFTVLGIPGLTLGCCLSNLVGAMLGMNPTGYLDAVIGSIATLLAAFCSWQLGKCPNRWARYLLVPLPPVFFNGLIVGGLELGLLFNQGGASAAAFWFNAGSVALGEAVICYTLGILMMVLLGRKDFYRRLF